jgi:hypothetical protein
MGFAGLWTVVAGIGNLKIFLKGEQDAFKGKIERKGTGNGF